MDLEILVQDRDRKKARNRKFIPKMSEWTIGNIGPQQLSSRNKFVFYLGFVQANIKISSYTLVTYQLVAEFHVLGQKQPGV